MSSLSAPLPAIEPIHGVWVSNVGSKSMSSAEGVRETIDICKRKGINAVFVVVWNQGMTAYPSKVLERYIGVKQAGYYKGFDPLAAFVSEGHKAGIKVHAWFEFGFSYHYGKTPSVWAQKYPQWIGRDSAGNPLYKNGFAWWNSLNPGPQKLLRELILEVVNQYDVDGIQGDDRLPAMPSEGGYEPETLEQFRKATGFVGTPEPKDPKWIQWRCDALSEFGKSIYQDVKKARKSCLVSWAPSIYPWSKEQYLQEWPTWLRGGYADFVMPQVYRYNLKDYQSTLKELRGQVSDEDAARVVPGILTALGGGYRVPADLLAKKLELNKSLGFQGECLFYFESLRDSK